MTVLTLPAEDKPLRFPRLLCLHGGGTNARIFRMQCRVLERALSGSFRLIYADGPFPAQPGPDVVSVYEKFGPFKAWQRSPKSHDQVKCSAQETIGRIEMTIFGAIRADDQRGATGKVVGLVGFSQGARMAASILHTQQVRRRHTSGTADDRWPELRFAVLLAGRGPLVWLAPETVTAPPPGLVDATRLAMTAMEEDEPVPTRSGSCGLHDGVLQIPTIHVHGLRDPGLELHRWMLRQCCSPSSVTLLEWDGGHRVPIESKHVNLLVQQIYLLAGNLGVFSHEI